MDISINKLIRSGGKKNETLNPKESFVHALSCSNIVQFSYDLIIESSIVTILLSEPEYLVEMDGKIYSTCLLGHGMGLGSLPRPKTFFHFSAGPQKDSS